MLNESQEKLLKNNGILPDKVLREVDRLCKVKKIN